MKAVIVGGGIGGLASALALTRHGWEAEVLERAAAFTEVGAGLSLWPNGLRALDALGVGAHVRERALLEGQAGIRDASGRWLSRTDTAALERRYGAVAMIHRADLLAVLRAAVPAGCLRNAVTVSRVRADGIVVHSCGESGADLIVGADGIRSVVRTSMWPDAPSPRYVGYTAWRMVTPPVPVESSSESWGSGERFGYARLPDGRVYCFAVANAPEGATGDGLAGLRRRFSGWHSPIPALEVYDRLRRRRTQMVTLRAHRVGVAAQWESPVAVGLHNTALRLLPRSSFIRSLAPVLDWTA